MFQNQFMKSKVSSREDLAGETLKDYSDKKSGSLRVSSLLGDPIKGKLCWKSLTVLLMMINRNWWNASDIGNLVSLANSEQLLHFASIFSAGGEISPLRHQTRGLLIHMVY